MGEEDLLAPRRKAAKRTYVKYRVVTPERPLHVLEMDIKSKWVTGERRSGYILTILDTFTRQALHWQAGLCMTQHQVTHAWDQVIKHHLQPADLLNKKLHVEVRSDNGATVHRLHGARLLQGQSLGSGLHPPVHAPREWAYRELPRHLGRIP
jgi:transposase InsO family protein